MKKFYVLFILFALIILIFSRHEDKREGVLMSKDSVTVLTVSEQPYDQHQPDAIFRSMMRSINDLNEEIDYLSLDHNNKITIDAGYPANGKYVLQDFILNRGGTMKYNSLTIIQTEIEFNNGKASVTLEENPFVFLSSQSSDYEPGAMIRGFKWVDESTGKEYGFVIRTDASRRGN